MKAERIVPQFILYEPAEAMRLDSLCRRGLVPFVDPPVLYVVGRYAVERSPASRDLLPFLANGQPTFGRFMVCAFGPCEATCTMISGLLGGGLRVGFENNLCLPGGGMAVSNAQLVDVARRGLDIMGIAAMSGEDLAADWSSL